MGWWARLFSDHCETCEVLKESLAVERALNKDLFRRLLPEKPEINSVNSSHANIEPSPRQYIPWKVKREMLEREDREKAKLMKQFEKPIDELEKEIGIS